jgi:predicted phosphodiesterase
MANVLIIGDTHCPRHAATATSASSGSVADSHDVTRVVHIGDLVDWASISFHEKPGLSNADSRVRAARRQVATLARAFPKADWLIGNHDALTERQAVAVGLPPQILATTPTCGKSNGRCIHVSPRS